MKTYKCSCCEQELQNIEKNKYECINESCRCKNSSMIINEGYYDIYIRDENTGEIKTEKKWCTKIELKPLNPAVLAIKDGNK